MEKSVLLPPNVFGLPSNGSCLDLSKRLVFLGRDHLLSVPNMGEEKGMGSNCKMEGFLLSLGSS